MVRAANFFPVVAVLVAAPAYAGEPAARVSVASGSLQSAIRSLAGQTGASIGFRDGSLGGIPVRAVAGTMAVERALAVMLRGTDLRARKVAQGTFLIERAPRTATRVPKRPVPPVVRTKPEQAPPLPPGPDIVVTASKRDIPLGAYPGGLQIMDGDEISTADAARGSAAIEARLASVVTTHLGPGRNKLFIRGIADSSFVGPTQATVGQYWGNSRITYSAPDPSLRLYDVRSVEVLEGPQGTLYGAGSLGGVVRVVPHAPDLERAGGSAFGGVQAIQHGQPGIDGGGVINIPLVEGKLGLRALAFGAIEGGYIDDTRRGLNDVNDVRTVGGRVAVRWNPGNDWTVDVNAVGQRIRGDDSQYTERGGGLSRESSIAQPYRNDFWLVDAITRKTWGPVELTTSLGYTRQYVFEQFEGAELAQPANPSLAPAPNASIAAFNQKNHIEMLTAETRLARKDKDGKGWLIGLSLLNNKARVNRSMEGMLSEEPLTGVRNKVREATLYGEGTIEPVRRLTVTLGGRLTHSRLSGKAQNLNSAMARGMLSDEEAVRKETRFLPSAAVAYRPTDRLTLFARYQQGFRPGGIAVRSDYIQHYKGDRVSTAEGGARYRTADFDIETTASWTRWHNIQADMIDGFGFPTTLNVGNGRVLSVGFASRWRPVQGLELDAALYLNESKVSEPSNLAVQIGVNTLVSMGTSGKGAQIEAKKEVKRLPNIADVSGRFGVTYTTALSDTVDLRARSYVRYVGKSRLGVGPVLGKLQGDYVDTGLELRVGKPNRGITLSLTNLLDSRGNRFALGSPFMLRDHEQITPLQPRTVRLGFDMSF